MKKQFGWFKRILSSGGAPDEINAEVLSRMAADGDDLQSPRDVEFNHQFSHEKSALDFLKAAKEEGYLWTDHQFSEEQLSWLTTIQVQMVPSLEEITEIEADLAEIAKTFGGRPDGWGCMEIIPTRSV